jgi:hypothetical protein
MVLDHGASDVTDRYILHDGTHLTWSVMRKWEAWLMGECERKQPVGETTVAPLFLMPPREGMPTPKVVEFRRMIVANQR